MCASFSTAYPKHAIDAIGGDEFSELVVYYKSRKVDELILLDEPLDPHVAKR